jgi:hypothetical protein
MIRGRLVNLSRRRLITALALGLFALRTLVPIGFMLSVGPARAAITLCPEFGPLPPAAGPHLAHHVHDHGAGVQLPGADAHSACPFGAAAHTAWHASSFAGGPVVAGHGAPLRIRAADLPVPGLRLELSRAPRGPPCLNQA